MLASEQARNAAHVEKGNLPEGSAKEVGEPHHSSHEGHTPATRDTDSGHNRELKNKSEDDETKAEGIKIAKKAAKEDKLPLEPLKFPTKGLPTEALQARSDSWHRLLQGYLAYFRNAREYWSASAQNEEKVGRSLQNDSIDLKELQIGDLEIVEGPHVLTSIHERAASSAIILYQLCVEVVTKLERLEEDIIQHTETLRSREAGFIAGERLPKLHQSIKEEFSNFQLSIAAVLKNQSPSEDPWIVRNNLKLAIQNQIDTETKLAKVHHNVSELGKNIDVHVFRTLQAVLGQYATESNQYGRQYATLSAQLSKEFAERDPEEDYINFQNKHRGYFAELAEHPRTFKDASYPHQYSNYAKLAMSGPLERRTKYLRSFTSADYALTPFSLIEFKNNEPVLGVDLSDAELLKDHKHSYGNKFVLKARQVGSSSGSHHTWVFRAEDARPWIHALEIITANKNFEQRVIALYGALEETDEPDPVAARQAREAAIVAHKEAHASGLRPDHGLSSTTTKDTSDTVKSKDTEPKELEDAQEDPAVKEETVGPVAGAAIIPPHSSKAVENASSASIYSGQEHVDKEVVLDEENHVVLQAQTQTQAQEQTQTHVRIQTQTKTQTHVRTPGYTVSTPESGDGGFVDATADIGAAAGSAVGAVTVASVGVVAGLAGNNNEKHPHEHEHNKVHQEVHMEQMEHIVLKEHKDHDSNLNRSHSTASDNFSDLSDISQSKAYHKVQREEFLDEDAPEQSAAWAAAEDLRVFSGIPPSTSKTLEGTPERRASASGHAIVPEEGVDDGASVFSYDLKHKHSTYDPKDEFTPVEADIPPEKERRLTQTSHRIDEHPADGGIGVARIEGGDNQEGTEDLLSRRRSSVSATSLNRKSSRRATASYGESGLAPLTSGSTEQGGALFFAGELPVTTSGSKGQEQ